MSYKTVSHKTKSHKTKSKRTKINLFLDLALTIVFLVLFKPFLTGLAVHEWLGIALGGALIVHTLLHRKWVSGIIRKWQGKLAFKTRVYASIDALLIIAFLTIIGSGIAMSRIVLPLFNLQTSSNITWFTIHKLSSILTLGLLGIKLVLHWKWIKNTIIYHTRVCHTSVCHTSVCHILGQRRSLPLEVSQKYNHPGHKKLIEETKNVHRILVIEEMTDIRQLLTKYLQREGYQVLTAKDGPSGLEVAFSQKPDLIVLDGYMIGMDGFQVCSKLRADPRMNDIPILFCTAWDEQTHKCRALELGANGYLCKPFHLCELKARITDLIGSRQRSWSPA